MTVVTLQIKIKESQLKPWRMEFARHWLQLWEPKQRSGLATQTKSTSVD